MYRPNVTVAMVLKSGERYLMVQERDKLSGEVVFNQPAGHLEENESLLDACARELFEETGLTAIPSGLVGIYSLQAKNGVHYLRFCFYAELDECERTQPQDSDIIACHWLTLEEIETSPLRSDLVRQCIHDAQSQPLIPLSYLHYQVDA
ncbi:NUDIX hydrolase [Pseudoalteromonas sp. T1lg75]|uniref:NUDIX hydrolase n=1 Tax=Pseudoalteromonas sp. T1lg75 TaxID=2077102 RepID=UPI000CF7134B|nr:NUDIX hydrolase [Pseudoalteromonas sp. T1lg75]